MSDPNHPIPTGPHVPAGSGAEGPLSPDHLRALSEARLRGKKIRRAAGVAALSGWTMVIFAIITMLGVVFGDFTALGFGLALLAVACNELRGGALVRRYDPRGARVLGYNQFLLGALIIAYGLWSMYQSLREPLLQSIGGTTGDPKMDEMMHQVSSAVTYGLYGGIIVIGFVVPALTAWYYFSRERLLRRMQAETPKWVMETLRTVG